VCPLLRESRREKKVLHRKFVIAIQAISHLAQKQSMKREGKSPHIGADSLEKETRTTTKKRTRDEGTENKVTGNAGHHILRRICRAEGGVLRSIAVAA